MAGNGEQRIVSDKTTTTTDHFETGTSGTGARAVGALLAKTRVASAQDITDVAQSLRISKRYLMALEEGRSEDLPATAYAIGFLRSYTEYLDLDTDEIVRRYKAGAESTEARSDLTFPKPIPEGGVPGGPILLIGLMVAALAYGIFSFTTSDDKQPDRVAALPERLSETLPPVTRPQADRSVLKTAPQNEPEAAMESAPKPTEPVVETSPEPVPEPEPVAATALQTEAQPEAQPEPTALVETPPETEMPVSRIQVRAKTNSWIQVRDETEDKLLFTRLLRKGDIYDVPARSGLTLLTGNAGALDILVDGKVVPSIGDAGDVRRNVSLDPEKLILGSAVND